MFVSIIMIFTVIIVVVVNMEVKEGIQRFAIEKAKSDLALGYEYIDQAYPGKWHIKDDQLYKGFDKFTLNYSSYSR